MIPPEAVGVIDVLFLLLLVAVLLGLRDTPCDEPFCRQVHHAHRERDRRAAILREHGRHFTKHNECDRCERDGPSRPGPLP